LDGSSQQLGWANHTCKKKKDTKGDPTSRIPHYDLSLDPPLLGGIGLSMSTPMPMPCSFSMIYMFERNHHRQKKKAPTAGVVWVVMERLYPLSIYASETRKKLSIVFLFALTHTHLMNFLLCHYLTLRIYFLLHYRDEHHKGKTAVPDTKVGEEGTAKRNIQRKGDGGVAGGAASKDKKQHGGSGGKGKWNDLDDGTMPE
jgi:hypothetical protein